MKLERDWSEEGETRKCTECNSIFRVSVENEYHCIICLTEALNTFHTKLSSEQVDMPPEFAEALNDNFLDLLV